MNQAYFSLNTNSFIQIRYMQPGHMQPRTYATSDTRNPGHMQPGHIQPGHMQPQTHATTDIYNRTHATPENYRSSKKIDLPIYPDKMFSLLSPKISDAGKE